MKSSRARSNSTSHRCSSRSWLRLEVSIWPSSCSTLARITRLASSSSCSRATWIGSTTWLVVMSDTLSCSLSDETCSVKSTLAWRMSWSRSSTMPFVFASMSASVMRLPSSTTSRELCLDEELEFAVEVSVDNEESYQPTHYLKRKLAEEVPEVVTRPQRTRKVPERLGF